MAHIFKMAAKTENKVLTLTFLREGTKILLGMKKRGLGEVREWIYIEAILYFCWEIKVLDILDYYYFM